MSPIVLPAAPLPSPRLTYEVQDPASPPAGSPAGAAEGSAIPNQLFLFAIIAVLFYVILIAPERKQRKKREAMLGAVRKGDEVLLTSGMYGTVASLSDDTLKVQVADGVRIKFSRAAIQQVLRDDDDGDEPGDKSSDSSK